MPRCLWVVRHGESAGNRARAAAEQAQAHWIDHVARDMDSPLSEVGVEQAQALARWFARQSAERRPQRIICSPYLRARQTARPIADALAIPLQFDERLREKEFGLLDRLTVHGIHHHYPDLAERRARVGKFYFRPPGGESWCDVILRLRYLLDGLWQYAADDAVLLIGHQVTVNCVRYVLEQLDEEAILAIDRAGDVPNCGLTCYPELHADRRPAVPELVNFVVPLLQQGAPATAEPDQPLHPGA